MCMMAYHSGYTDAGSGGGCITFVIASDYGSFSSVSINNDDRPDYELAFCACIAGEDCPSSFSAQPWLS